MVRATEAEVMWDDDKKRWVVRLRVGEEFIRRSCKGAERNAGPEALRALAVETAREEGYELPGEAVVVRD